MKRNDGSQLARSCSPTNNSCSLNLTLDEVESLLKAREAQYSGIGMQSRQQLYLAWRNHLTEKFPDMTYTDRVVLARKNSTNGLEVPRD